MHLFSEHRYVNIVGVVEEFDGDVEHQRVVCSRCDTKTARYGKNVDVLRSQRLNKHRRKMIVRHFIKERNVVVFGYAQIGVPAPRANLFRIGGFAFFAIIHISFPQTAF